MVLHRGGAAALCRAWLSPVRHRRYTLTTTLSGLTEVSVATAFPAAVQQRVGIHSTPPALPRRKSTQKGASTQEPRKRVPRQTKHTDANEQRRFSIHVETLKRLMQAAGTAPRPAEQTCITTNTNKVDCGGSGYTELFQEFFINPFNGKVTSAQSPTAHCLFRLGFQRTVDNPLQLTWSPTLYFKSFHTVLEAMQRKRAGSGATATAPLPTELVLSALLRPLESGSAASVAWRREVASLIRREDCLAVMNAELTRRYADLASAYMPPKLDSTPDLGVAEDSLTQDQANAVQLARRGYNLYVGGSAGTGKTVLLRAMYRVLRQFGLRIAMTATTGVAAVQLGGCTFHRAFNAPLDSSLVSSAVRRWDTNALRAVDVVIVDEISLLDAQLLDAFDAEARLARMSSLPFGGLQVIVCGDFLQLSNGTVVDALPAYASAAFSHLVKLKLVTPMRHAEGDPFLRLLNGLRRGCFDAAQFSELDRPVPADAAHITHVFPRRREAQSLNEAELSALPTAEMLFAPQRGPLQLVGRFTASALIEVADGAPRMEVVATVQEEVARVCPAAGLIAEHDCVVMPARSVTPSILLRLRHRDAPMRSGGGGGTTGDMAASQQHRHHSGGGDGGNAHSSSSGAGAGALAPEVWKGVVASRVAARLGGRLAGVMKVEPSGLVPLSVSMGLADMSNGDVAEVLAPLRLKLGCRVMVNRNLSRTVSNGSVGVVEAFSPPDARLFPRRPDCSNRSVYGRILEKKLFENLPVVRLLSGEVFQVPPIGVMLGGTAQSWFYGHEVYALPLQLGYGFTVHKVQGLTLEGTVVLDCKHFFECPHLVYVACSRVRSMEQLVVRNIKPEMVIVKRSALEFSESLPEARDPLTLAPSPDTPRASWAMRIAPRIYSLTE